MSDMQQNDLQARQKRAVNTALVLAAVAVTVFVAFLLSGILGH